MADATFFGSRENKDGPLIFLDSTSGRVLWHKFIQSETKENYLEGLLFLEKNKFEILSVTLDGRRGINQVFRKSEFRDFLDERNQEHRFIHRNLRSALYGIRLALPYLFTYQNCPSLQVPSHTNHIDGGINPKLKDLVRRHRGMNIQRRNKLLVNLLYSLPNSR